MKTPKVYFDPRVKLLTVLSASLLLVSRGAFAQEFLFMVLLTFLLILSGGARRGLGLLGAYGLIVVIHTLFFQEVTGSVSAFMSFFLVGNRMFIPPITAAVFAATGTKISEWVAAFRKWHVPTTIIIPFIVVCRFFPTLWKDLKHIRNAMRFRGMGDTVFDLIKHPFQTLEFIVVPLLMSVDNTATELSAAALTRGLGNQGEHTSVYDVKWQSQDYALLIVLISVVILGRRMG